MFNGFINGIKSSFLIGVAGVVIVGGLGSLLFGVGALTVGAAIGGLLGVVGACVNSGTRPGYGDWRIALASSLAATALLSFGVHAGVNAYTQSQLPKSSLTQQFKKACSSPDTPGSLECRNKPDAPKI